MKSLIGSVLLAFLFIQGGDALSQCGIVINELVINGPGACDGSCNPNTEEWVELYNTCNAAIDLSCWVLGDGDFTITFPQGTVIAPGGHVVVGSDSSGPNVDINLASCNCTAGSLIGTYTNANEQLILLNASGAVQDAIYWGSGQFPVAISSPSVFGCSAVSFNTNSPDPAVFEQLPLSGGNGCSVARSCDGGADWQERCGAAITQGATNGSSVIPSFIASQNEICAGACISFTYSGAAQSSYEWEFPGSQTPESFAVNPTGICYAEPGVYDVLLTVASSCGTFTILEEQIIIVTSVNAPVISANGPLEICSGETVALTSSENQNIQWLFNNVPLQGENGANYIATVPGTYQVLYTLGECEAYSNQLEVITESIPSPAITPEGVVNLCEGEQVTIGVPPLYATYTWYLNGDPLPAGEFFIEASEAGEYSVEVTDGACSTFSDVVEINVFPAPVVSLSESGAIELCEGESVSVSATPGFPQYEWTLNGNPVGTATSQQQFNLPGAYQASVTVGQCTAQSEMLFIDVAPAPALTISPEPQIISCSGESVEVTVASDVSASSIAWLINGNIIQSGNDSSLDASQSGEYEVSVTSADGCTSSLSFPVYIATPATPEIASSTGVFTICQGESLTLSNSGDWASYSWEFNGAEIASEASVEVGETGMYTLFVTDDFGCDFSNNEFVTVELVLTPIISPQGPALLCNGETITLSANTFVQYWTLNGVPVPNSGTIDFEATLSGTYTAVAATGSCEAESTPVVVNIAPAIQVNIQSSDSSPCEGEAVTLSVNGNYSFISWVGGSQNNSIQVTASGEYSVTVGGNNDCIAEDDITVNFTPLPLADAGPDVFNICGEGVVLQSAASGGSIQWIPSVGLSDESIAQPLANPFETATYQLVVSNGDCVSTDEVQVISDCSGIRVPNVFTPNNDGENDAFEIVVTGEVDFELFIFNRHGQLVFESKDPANQWRGEFNGNPVPEGTYYYVLRAEDLTGNDLTGGKQEGHITLLR
jgi:gliding motility-associated-like protein